MDAIFIIIALIAIFSNIAKKQKKQEEARRRNQEQQAAWRRSNPGGFSLDPVIASFRQNISRLERLTLAARKADRRRR